MLVKNLSLIPLALFICWHSAEAAKILVFNPKFGASHVSFTGKIADILAAAGHQVIVYQPVVNENITSTGSKHASIKYYSKPRNFSVCPEFSIEGLQGNFWEKDSMLNKFSQMSTVYKIKHDFCLDFLNDKENLLQLKLENFDLGVTEFFEACGYGVFETIGLKNYISTTGSTYIAWHMKFLGIPIPFSYTPGFLSTFTDQMPFFERFKNYLLIQIELIVLKKMGLGGHATAIQEAVNPNFDIEEAVQKSKFIFINTDEMVDYTLPITPKIVFIGGMGKIQSKQLENKYVQIFDNAKKGVILFSFGSVVRSASMPSAIKQGFLEAFAEFPDITFLWKYEEDDDVGKGLKNVIKEKWLPQPDILDHPKLLAFISHGGMNSVLEGVLKGVPMICVPVFGDQVHNAQILYRRGTSVTLNKADLTKESIVAAIKEVTSNKKYKQNAQLMSKLVKAKPMSADERVIKFTEFAVSFGDAEAFTTSGSSMNFIQLYSVDVIAAYSAVLAFVIIIFGLILRLVWRCICCRCLRSSRSTPRDKKNQ